MSKIRGTVPSAERLQALAELKRVEKRLAELGETPANAAEGAAVPTAAPFVTTGEFGKSRPFSFTKALGLASGILNRDQCKVEADAIEGINKALDATNSRHSGMGHGGVTMVLDPTFLKSEVLQHEGARRYFGVIDSVDAEAVDVEEIAYRLQKSGGLGRINKTAMSYLTDSIGGASVAPPAMGGLIDLKRNKSALDRAGATVMPLPSQGRIVFPRVTGTTTGYLVGENTAATESNPTLGQTSMEAKKIMANARVPNELFLYSSISIDAWLRSEINKTLTLTFDRLGLYGGGNGTIRGLIQYTGTGELFDYAAATPAPKGIGTDGNSLKPEDGYNMAGQILDRNFDDNTFKWVGRPKLRNGIVGYRSDAITAGDKAGTFVQDLTRGFSYSAQSNWCGYEFVTSAQVRTDQTKGSSGATLTELFGGCWENCYLGMYGAVQFDMNKDGGDSSFQADQTLIRAKMFGDVAFVHPGAFAYYKLLLSR